MLNILQVIPVESSMEGNRHKFSSFLHGVVCVLSFILGGFGMLGYLRFGSEVNQMLNTNIPATTWIAVAVNICVLIGVLLTFPMQMYPVTEMIEILLFSHGKFCFHMISSVLTLYVLFYHGKFYFHILFKW